ncbi:MAG: hypothetical protein M5U34_42315 [Chloroflexi bacterium]|nr:hypothetical protein [Chloroflexota bacterium]
MRRSSGAIPGFPNPCSHHKRPFLIRYLLKFVVITTAVPHPHIVQPKRPFSPPIIPQHHTDLVSQKTAVSYQ